MWVYDCGTLSFVIAGLVKPGVTLRRGAVASPHTPPSSSAKADDPV